MKSVLSLITLREILKNKGRYLSIMAITALGVGFFGGLKITDRTMQTSIQTYYDEQHLYDLHLISTVGFTDDDINQFQANHSITYAEGTQIIDVLFEGPESSQIVLTTYSMPDSINQLHIDYGRMPESDTECILDSIVAGKEAIGKVIRILPENDETTISDFHYTEYTIVGIASSPYYLSNERGNTSLGNGRLSGTVYLPRHAYAMDYYTDLFLCYDHNADGYSDDYEGFVRNQKALIEPLCRALVIARGEALIDQALTDDDTYSSWMQEYENMSKETIAIDTAKDFYSEFVNGVVRAASNLGHSSTNQDSDTSMNTESDDSDSNSGDKTEFWEVYRLYQSMKNPSYYILDRTSNPGYTAFDQNTEIINSVADVFPVFFLLIAMLVCMTTMSRMIEEQRTQIGILKALGYDNRTIITGYLLYAGSAAGIGSVIGYYAGTYIIPKVLWIAYGLMYQLYGFTYVWNPWLAFLTIVAAILASTTITYLTCRHILTETSAELMRPRAPKAGKRVLLEHIAIIWNHLKFLQKVSIRNIFRYKKRLFMMILGISGCTALLLTGFGIKDSIAGFANIQYQTIETYDASIMLQSSSAGITQELQGTLKETTTEYQKIYETSGTINDTSASIRIFSEPETADHYMQYLSEMGEQLQYPGSKQALISNNLAQRLGVKTGDTITFQLNDNKSITVIISGIYENYIYNYIIISPETYRHQTGNSPDYNLILANMNDANESDIYQKASEILTHDEVLAVTLSTDTIQSIDNIMKNLNYVIILVILCSALLAFIVLYNLTNINITERIREIATIKVLGFFKHETASYIFRENLILTLVGAAIGLGLGKLLHQFIIQQIDLEWMSFPVIIKGWSYLYSYILTIAFNLIINIFMSRHIDQIDMVESLKSVD